VRMYLRRNRLNSAHPLASFPFSNNRNSSKSNK
jgi:hypothetical protein